MEANEFSKIIDAIVKLTEKKILNKIEDIVQKNTVSPDNYQSLSLEKLAPALAKAQGEFKPVAKNRENPYFKSQYTDLDAILKAVRPALSANGLSFTQYTEVSDKGPTILRSRILHASGQWIETRSRLIPTKNDQQSYGSALTYQKRYSAMAILGVTSTDDIEDDDAELAMTDHRVTMAKGTKVNTNYKGREQSTETITKEQLEELEYELSECPDIAEEILDKLRLQSIADMPKNLYAVSVRRVREIKNLRKGE